MDIEFVIIYENYLKRFIFKRTVRTTSPTLRAEISLLNILRKVSCGQPCIITRQSIFNRINKETASSRLQRNKISWCGTPLIWLRMAYEIKGGKNWV